MAALAAALGVAPIASPADAPPQPTTHETAQSLIEVWIVLSEPALATLPRDATEQRSELRARIAAEQNRVLGQLRSLGAIETGRTQQAQNALAVRLPTSSLDAVKNIDGVTSVRSANDRNRIHD